ncbi:MAG: DegT/DnrJ/EryC1/StrS family aminotransferase, partial [Bacteroidales bacterium]|nr:DegT/DnrJ/EryC1/StrS family aminotransferase [Bacteroidales bacterium]
LGDLSGIDFMPEPKGYFSNRWLTCCTINPKQFGTSRDEIRLILEKENIESRPLWKPMHLQPVFAKYPIRGGQVAESLFENGLCLPSGSSLQQNDLERVVGIIQNIYKTNNRIIKRAA